MTADELSAQPQQVQYVRTPHLYPKQEAAIFNDARIAVVEASTKSGKTEGCIGWLFEQAVQGQPGWHYWWVAYSIAQSRIAYDRLKLNGPREHMTTHDTNRTITLSNGTILSFKTADDDDALYGEDVHGVVMDEASRMREAAWVAVFSTLTATEGKARVIGNVKGRKNWAYQLARAAEAGESGMSFARITADDAVAAGVLTQESIDLARQRIPERAFQELFFCQPGDGEHNPFGIEAIQECIGEQSEDPPRVWGWDLAKSVDWTVGVGLDAERRTCGFERWQGVDWGKTVERIRQHTVGTPALVDSTGVGSPVVDRLQEKGGDYEGYLFGSKSKQHLMDGLAMAIQERLISFPEGPIVSELESFEYEHTTTGVRYAAPEGQNDDCVCALALANWHHIQHPPPVSWSTVSVGGKRGVSENTPALPNTRVTAVLDGY